MMIRMRLPITTNAGRVFTRARWTCAGKSRASQIHSLERVRRGFDDLDFLRRRLYFALPFGPRPLRIEVAAQDMQDNVNEDTMEDAKTRQTT